MSNLPPYSLGLTASAREKRNHQLRQWESSLTNREPDYIVTRRRTGRVKFSQDVVFMAAVSSGDQDEVTRLVTEEHANVNCTNSDGLTPLHQCCIDDNLEMMMVLVKHGANVNSSDNEGWTPLHAAASCGYLHIVKYLLEHNAFPAMVNNEGQTPADLAEEHGSSGECQTPTDTESYNKIVELLNAEIDRLDLDVDEIKSEEEMVMLADAKKLRLDSSLEPIISPGGATPLHIAAAKEYTTVLNVLLSIPGVEVDPRDDDGWTPLHAALYWGSMDAAELLILSGANIFLKTNNSETIDDLCDPDYEDELRRLKKLNSSINPEQAELFSRKGQPTIYRQKASLTHTMSIDNQKNSGSPGLKRRLSKERLTPKLDMQKEREDLLHSLESLGEDPQESSNGGIPAESQNTYPPPPVQHQDSLQDSPKSAKRMSTKMLAKVSMFEQASTSPPVPRSTSTPVNSPQVNGPIEPSKKFTDSSEMRPRVTSVDVPVHSGKKRFLFQSNPVSGSPTLEKKEPSSFMRKTMSLDRQSNTVYKEAMEMQSNRVVAASNGEPTTQPEITATTKPVTEAKAPQPVLSGESQIVAMSSSSQTIDTSAASSSELNRTDSTSSASSTSSSIFSRSSSVANAESRRKSEAREKRKTRRPTQPVPSDLLDRIVKIDSIEEQQYDGGAPNQTLQPAEETPQQTDQTPQPTAPLHPLVKQSVVTKPTADSDTTPLNTDDKIPSASPIKAIHIQTKVEDVPAQSSTYRRRSQAFSKSSSVPTVTSPTLTSPTGSESKAVITIEQVVSPRRVSEPCKPSENILKVEDTSGLSPAIARTKSTTRRKPKEKRRSTGIPTEVEEGEEVPEVLKGIVKTKSSGEPSDSNTIETKPRNESTSKDPAETIIPSAVEGTEHSDSTSTLDYYNEEIARLKKLLSEHQADRESVLSRYQQACSDLKRKDQQIAELQRRCEDSKRAYEQEKLEREQKEKKIQQLEKSQKGVQELKAEIQRLRDENGALIRVVGKLSRAPLNT